MTWGLRFHLFIDILSGKKSTFNRFIESIKNEWDTGRYVPVGDLIQNLTIKYNNTIADKWWTKRDPKDSQIIALK